MRTETPGESEERRRGREEGEGGGGAGRGGGAVGGRETISYATLSLSWSVWSQVMRRTTGLDYGFTFLFNGYSLRMT